MTRPRTPSPVLVLAAVFAAAALVTGVLGFAASGAGPAAAGLTAQPVAAPPADPHPLWLPRHARLTAADVAHARTMARAARQVARARARRQARQARAAAALAAQQAAQQAQQQQAAQAAQPAAAAPAASGGGILTSAQIGQLWLSEGGSPAAEQTAECIAGHESGGNPDDVSPPDWDGLRDYGLFQEHDRPDVLGDAALSTQVAIAMSSNGSDWGAWSTAGACGV